MDNRPFTSQEYQDLVKRLDEISKRLAVKETGMKERWIDNTELMNLLKISRRTAQSYRDNNMIAFSIIGNKIFYKISEVESLLERHYRKRLV